MVKVKVLLVLLGIVCLTSACGDYQPIETSLNVVAVGIDRSDGQYKVTVIGADYLKTKLRLSGKGESVMDAMTDIQSMTSKSVVFSHLESILFSRAVAKKGLDRVLDAFLRNIQIRSDTNVLVVKGKAADYFDQKKIKTPITGRTYAYQLRTSAVQFDPHIANLHSLMLSETIAQGNFMLPELAIHKKQKVVVLNGFALCKGGKLELEVSMKQAAALLVLRRAITTQTLTLHHLGTTLQVRYSTPRMRVHWVGRAPTFTYDVYMKDEVLEQNPYRHHPMTKAMIRNIQHSAARKMAKECRSLIKKLQAHELDAIWLAESARVANPSAYQRAKWETTFADATFQFHIHLKVERSGQLF